MNESNSIEAIDRTNWTAEKKFRLDEISKIENYFRKEINQRKSCSKKIKQIFCWFWLNRQDFDCFMYNKGWSIYHFVYERSWSYCRNSKCKFHFNFFSNNRNSIILTIKKKKSMIKFIIKSKLNSTENLISQALIDMEISHKEFIAILWRKIKIKRWKKI